MLGDYQVMPDWARGLVQRTDSAMPMVDPGAAPGETSPSFVDPIKSGLRTTPDERVSASAFEMRGSFRRGTNQ